MSLLRDCSAVGRKGHRGTLLSSGGAALAHNDCTLVCPRAASDLLPGGRRGPASPRPTGGVRAAPPSRRHLASGRDRGGRETRL